MKYRTDKSLVELAEILNNVRFFYFIIDLRQDKPSQPNTTKSGPEC